MYGTCFGGISAHCRKNSKYTPQWLPVFGISESKMYYLTGNIYLTAILLFFIRQNILGWGMSMYGYMNYLSHYCSNVICFHAA